MRIYCERYPSLKVYIPREERFIKFVDGVFETDDPDLGEFIRSHVAEVEVHKEGEFKGPSGEWEELAPKKQEAPVPAQEESPRGVLYLSVAKARTIYDEIADPDFFRQAIEAEEGNDPPRSSMLKYLRERLAILS